MDLRSQQRLHTQPRGADAPQAEESAYAAAPAARRNAPRSRVNVKKIALGGVIALVLITGVLAALWAFPGGMSGIKGNQYQAVFLSNGQVYFGKIKSYSGDSVVLGNIYYLQQSVQNQDSKTTDANASNQLSLTKLGNELHGPEDTMYIERKQVLFWENLKDDSQVVKTIKQAEKK